MILKATEENIKKAAEVIRKGGLVAFPTETVYGLGADALNKEAVAKIFEVKQRPLIDPVIVHISKFEDLEKLAYPTELAYKLAKAFWPGPLTMVLPKKEVVPSIVTAGLDFVAIRMPAHPVALKLIEESKTFIAAPSANLFSKLSPTRAEHVYEQLGDKVDIILDGGKCDVGVESTIIDLTTEPPTILRLGGLDVEAIEKVIGEVKITKENKKIKAPGMLKKHYSPTTPLKIMKEPKPIPNLRCGLLAFKEPREGFEVVEILSRKGDLREAAANLYDSLHRLDKQNLDIIIAEAVPEVGLGRAIMDRLRKAQGL
ncbi:Sua5/YciO/YrdC/YwlC family protein [Methanocaldococcus infernus ME]|uniref:Threonylcarbamoyl-AMP synthase n=1 Tax=Methanocaldococcus infernus (strain DSM 11812 / JCM 15783 / ME) TaxID=573063 RepID=D5VS69_METIM|nr:L-threonylcarbamoyladenylate synthase [Methanocaldococcus infernus]ADG13422.1 Sua5/YciO/YrdC/YwlC family protein [Methanocaldococcus infernus ME]